MNLRDGEGTRTRKAASAFLCSLLLFLVTAFGSVNGGDIQMQAGRDANIVASNVLADQNVDISAGRNVHVLVARDAHDTQFESHSKSTSFGLTPGLTGWTLFGPTNEDAEGKFISILGEMYSAKSVVCDIDFVRAAFFEFAESGDVSRDLFT